MAKNKIQFQKGMSIPDFMQQYGTEDKCRHEILQLRWPNGFICPNCGNDTYCTISKREVFQCNRCHRQTSITAGTIFHSTSDQMVFGDILDDPKQKWDFSLRAFTSDRCLAQCRLANETQADASHA
jgi:hypothetical protein